MAFEQKPNSGSLFRNEEKKSDTHAEYKGSAMIDGVEYWMDGWVNEIKSGEKAGKKYFNLKFKPKEHRSQQSRGASRQSAPEPIDDDETPF